MANNKLHEAKRAKSNEFFTQSQDIEKEMINYLPHFRGKIVLCNCNDTPNTGFAKHFADMFGVYGLKQVICTSYNPKGKGIIYRYYGGDWEEMPMNGNGGFNTPEGITLIQEADIIATNPPFSLFREFISLLIEYNKKFIILGNMNAITYKEVFPLIKNNQLWLGVSISSGDRKFNVPNNYPLNAAYCGVDEQGNKFIRVKGIRWFTNIDHRKRHQILDLYKKYSPEEYPTYDNYNAIEVSKTGEIPVDYNGVMGVPITFMDKYCPEQFDIIWTIDRGGDGMLEELKIKDFNKPWDSAYINGKKTYKRILIKRKM